MKRVGKVIGGCLYIHKSAINTLRTDERALVDFGYRHIPLDFNYEVIKINLKGEKVSFINSKDWNTSLNPSVDETITVDKHGMAKFRRSSGMVYHYKELFVEDTYKGFDIEESKTWNEYWENHQFVKALKEKDKSFRQKIGSKKYWNMILDNIRGK